MPFNASCIVPQDSSLPPKHCAIIYEFHSQRYTAESHIWLTGKQLFLWSTSATTMLAPTASSSGRFAGSNMRKQQTKHRQLLKSKQYWFALKKLEIVCKHEKVKSSAWLRVEVSDVPSCCILHPVLCLTATAKWGWACHKPQDDFYALDTRDEAFWKIQPQSGQIFGSWGFHSRTNCKIDSWLP